MCLCTVASEVRRKERAISSKLGEYPCLLAKPTRKSSTSFCRLVRVIAPPFAGSSIGEPKAKFNRAADNFQGPSSLGNQIARSQNLLRSRPVLIPRYLPAECAMRTGTGSTWSPRSKESGLYLEPAQITVGLYLEPAQLQEQD